MKAQPKRKPKKPQTEQIPGRPVRPPEDETVIGRFARPIGVFGDVKVIMEPVQPERIFKLKDLTIAIQGEHRQFRVERVTEGHGWYRVKLKDVDSAEMAGLLSGGEIITSVTERPQLPTGEYYVDELVGCSVVADDGDELGMLIEVLSHGNHDTWVIDGTYGEILVPAVKEFIIEVDIEQHHIVIQRVKGLWDEA